MLTAALIILSALLAAPALVLLAECLLGRQPLQEQEGVEPPPLAVLIPAHDEAGQIAQTIAALKQQLRPGDRLLVVADNCTDDTAAIARAAGAEVVERTNAQQRGKGFALAAGRDALAVAPPDVVVLIDADCELSEGGLERLAACAVATGAVQCRYVLLPPADGDLIVAVSAFAFRMKNVVRQRALARLGAPALLQGTGMAFRWDVLRDAPLASAALAEDAELGLALVIEGRRIVWTETVTCTSPSASVVAMGSQRERWERGFLASAFPAAARLLPVAIQLRRPALLWLALDLLVPPLTMLLAALVLVTAASFVATLAGLGSAPLAIASIGMAGFFLSVTLAWLAEGRAVLTGPQLRGLPRYLLWKLALYLRMTKGGTSTWVRTERH